MEELLDNIDYPDRNLCHRCRTGFNIVGGTDETGVFTTKPLDQRTEGADPIWLPKLAKEHRAALGKAIADQGINDILKDLYGTTTAEGSGEVARGGPRALLPKKR